MTTGPDYDQIVVLEAVDHSRNIARRYGIEVSRDLFGVMIVRCSWGRIGSRGQSRSVSFDTPHEAGRYVRSVLRRRETAPSRIGVAYRRWELS
ncbi:WGR domain-containing protein [Sphingobium sufflavum]|uniref:WGR domain-containing protein n=1 Tax=Sphingobium sufflavum TaxID=1129547 RepID=UPI001F44DC2D|nr:WGR domain-containing protein [Sphingobium sufflavum]MCE7798704.1 WGR domain-containing protein [Sphingobium sufflavum]